MGVQLNFMLGLYHYLKTAVRRFIIFIEWASSARNGCASSTSTSWLGCQDSNLGMAESESAALPLGDTPKMVAMTGFEPVTPAL